MARWRMIACALLFVPACGGDEDPTDAANDVAADVGDGSSAADDTANEDARTEDTSTDHLQTDSDDAGDTGGLTDVGGDDAANEVTEPVGALPRTGTGEALGGLDGITGTVDGTTYTFTRNAESDIPNVGWGPLDPRGERYNLEAYAPDGSSFDPLTSWRLPGIPPAPGIYACRTEQGETIPAVRLTRGGQVVDASVCTIEVQSVSAGAVTGRFAAELDGHTVSDGYFRVSADTQ